MMLERSLEIIVRQAFREIFAADWSHVAQQMSLPSGRIDLLFQDGVGVLHVVELKKGPASLSAIDQVLGYAADLRSLFPEKLCIPWVLANSIGSSVELSASTQGVRTKVVTQERLGELMELHGLNESLLVGPRRADGILHGGGSRHGLRSRIDNSRAFSEMPRELAQALGELEKEGLFDIASGEMQTTLWYRGIKLGGVNRKHRGGVIYLSEGIAIREEYMRTVEALGFRRMEKIQSGSSHMHIWWEIPWKHVQNGMAGLAAARGVVDRVFDLN